jgi:hypothetical protein
MELIFRAFKIQKAKIAFDDFVKSPPIRMPVISAETGIPSFFHGSPNSRADIWIPACARE